MSRLMTHPPCHLNTGRCSLQLVKRNLGSKPSCSQGTELLDLTAVSAGDGAGAGFAGISFDLAMLDEVFTLGVEAGGNP